MLNALLLHDDDSSDMSLATFQSIMHSLWFNKKIAP